MKTILVAFDGSEQSQKAFEFAVEVASKFRAKLVAVAVIRLPEPAISVEIEALLDEGRTHFAEEFSRLENAAARQGVVFESQIVVGHPAEQIVRHAEDLHADLIVMGRRGLSRATRWILGSVSQRVMAYAHCPVTVVTVLK